VVLDTNVLLSAIFARGVCQAVLDAVLESAACTLVVSDYILDEFRRVAIEKFRVPEAEAQAAVDFIVRNGELVRPADVAPGVCPDKDDLAVIGTALAGRAGILVTGDRALHELREILGVRIVSPREFYGRWR
jgi:putative PIN family toxin of toxin-antitoxin system